MNEEIRKNKIPENELENVSGGANGDVLLYPRLCPLCGKRCLPNEDGTGFVCVDCSIQFF